VIDVAEEFAAGHVVGAKNIPLALSASDKAVDLSRFT
jgi:hypothetical protein